MKYYCAFLRFIEDLKIMRIKAPKGAPFCVKIDASQEWDEWYKQKSKAKNRLKQSNFIQMLLYINYKIYKFMLWNRYTPIFNIAKQCLLKMEIMPLIHKFTFKIQIVKTNREYTDFMNKKIWQKELKNNQNNI